ncbi:MAG: response regulator [Candidatus Rokubacteria bacterium]|nr:response regulator [Candidatus Rokubacteria bacterium]
MLAPTLLSAEEERTNFEPRVPGSAGWTSRPESERSAEAWPAPEAKAKPAVSGARIMVVDDMADVRELLSDFLVEEGYTVEAFGNASDALLRLDEFRPRVILLDILMPGLSGLSVLEQIRATNPEVGIIMVTGIGDDTVARQTLALGAFDYVTKPIDFDYLKRTVETFLLMRGT